MSKLFKMTFELSNRTGGIEINNVPLIMFT